LICSGAGESANPRVGCIEMRRVEAPVALAGRSAFSPTQRVITP
jgi:hypothetical protein